MARRTRQQPLKSSYGRGYDFNKNPINQPLPKYPKSPKEFTVQGPEPVVLPDPWLLDRRLAEDTLELPQIYDYSDEGRKTIDEGGQTISDIQKREDWETLKTQSREYSEEGRKTISDIQQRENLAGHTRDRWETLKPQSREYNESARQRLAATADSLKNIDQALMDTTDPEVRKILERTRDELTAVIKPPK
jgi:acyl-CoA-binding protein